MRFRTAGLLVLVTTGAIATLGSSAAGARMSCHSGGSKVIKRTGNGIIYARSRPAEGIVYTACSTVYGKRVRLGADASALVDESFQIKTARVDGRTALFVYCVQYDAGYYRATVNSDLKSGRSTRRNTPIASGGSC